MARSHARDDRWRPETLQELFDEYRIELHGPPIPGRQHGGARSKIYCPQCLGGREKERNFFVVIDPDGQGAAWQCFRANNCGFSGGARLQGAPDRDRTERTKPKHYRRPDPPAEMPVPDKLVAYYERFGISEDTLRCLNIYRTEHRMPLIDDDGKEVKDQREWRPVIAFPYYDDGELVNVKYKAVYPRGGKLIKRFMQEFGTRRSLFNIDSFKEDAWGLVTEGEDDVAAIYESGWHQVTTLPDGSPTKLAETYDRATDDDQRYVALYGEPRIDCLKKVYLAGDMDPAGVRHMEEVARRIGKERCWLVRWPGECKDAKQTLQERGPEAVCFAIENAVPYPLEGVHLVTDEEITALHGGRFEPRIITGMPAIDERFCLNEAGQLIVCTGISGRGKTTFWNAMAVLYAERNEEEMKHDRMVRPFHTVLISAETKPAVLSTKLISQRAHQPFWSGPMIEGTPLDAVLGTYMPWVRRNFTFIRWPDRAIQPPVSWVKDRIRENVRRTGAKLVIVDPWQEFDDEMPNREYNHSRWLGKVIQGFVGLADELRANIVIVVHPTKLKADKDGKLPIPDGNDIADTRHFESRCDIGITVHRANLQSEDMLLRVWKVKDPRFGRYGETTLRLDPQTFRLWPKPVPAADGKNWSGMK